MSDVDPLDEIFSDAIDIDVNTKKKPAQAQVKVNVPRPAPLAPDIPEFEPFDITDGEFPSGDIDDDYYTQFRHRGEREIHDRKSVELFDIGNAELPTVVLSEIAGSDARYLNVIPVSLEGSSVTIVCEDPHDVDLLGKLRPLLAGRTVHLIPADPASIRRRIDEVYSAGHEAAKIAQRIDEDEAPSESVASGQNLGRVGAGLEGRNNKLLRLIIEQGIREGASDIHLEPVGHGLEVRNRIDGKLHLRGTYPADVERGLTTLVKVESHMRADTHMVPDSGVMIFKPNGATIAVDIRVETAPCAWGQTVVLRLQNEVWRDLSTLGFTSDNEKRFREAIAQPYGIILVTGPTGSGKHLKLSTTIPTPSGNTTMGDLSKGDWVLGRDGLPCRVTHLWPINKTPDLYRLTFSDGQHIDADLDHQWLVSDHYHRNVPRTKKRRTAIERFEKGLLDADAIERLGESWTGATTSSCKELFDLLVEHGLTTEFVSEYAVRVSLIHMACPSWNETRVTNPNESFAVVRDQNVVLYRSAEVLAAIAGTNSAANVQAQALLVTDTLPVETSLKDLTQALPTGSRTIARDTVNRFGITGRACVIEQEFEVNRVQKMAFVAYPTDIALKTLAVRLRQRFSSAPSDDALLVRMTTGEMLEAGIRLARGQANFAIPLASALNLPEAVLAVDPYVLGAWLGDGRSGSGQIIADHKENAGEKFRESDQIHMMEEIKSAGYECHKIPSEELTISVVGILSVLREIGARGNKHIPVSYLRASVCQRLAVLQGLMDTDGTIDKNGSCELSLFDDRLATDALDLIRSLGIKASKSIGPASYVDDDGVRVDCKDRHRIYFTTTRPVFRLPRKRVRLPESVRETQGWVYLTCVEKITSEPARCITVDSADSTYLCGDGYLVTSNTTTLYSAVNERISPDTKIITLENPIEFKIPSGVTQMSVNEEQGMTFTRGLKSIVRQDPDVVLIGEIRDPETAETAVDAAMTGHLVFSTLHTNDAVGAIPRMTRLGIEPFLLSSSLLAVIGQRLVRRLCTKCKEPYKDEIDGKTVDVFRNHAEGCLECFGGFSGRVPIHEVLLVDDEIRQLIAKNADQPDLLVAARKMGMTTMREDGFLKVLEGITSISEVVSNTRS